MLAHNGVDGVRFEVGGRVLASERAVLGAFVLTFALTLGSWVLMRFGVYTLARALGITLAVAAFFVWRAARAPKPAPIASEPWPWLGLAGALCLAFGVLYAAYPTYFLLGGQDPGPYLAFAARIAKTGGLNLYVPEVQYWVGTHAPGLWRTFPAVYGNLGAPPELNALTPQFVHLFTAYMANFWSAGVEGAVRSNAWLGTLCLATGFVLLRRMGSLVAAFAFVLALGVNPAFVWASRITLTEVTALWLNLSGLLLLLLAWDLESMAFGVCAGAVLGTGVLNRLDGGLGALAVAGFAAATLLDQGRRRWIAVACALANLAVSHFGYFDGQRLAPQYFRDLEYLSGGDVTKLMRITSALDMLAVMLALVPTGLKTALGVNETRLRLLGYGGVLLLALWIGYGVTLRTLASDPETATTVLELTWFTSWVAWPLFFLGLGVALGARNFQRYLPLVLFTAGTVLIYTSRTDVVHEYMWASRRWVPHVIPLIFASTALGAAYVVASIRARPAALATGLAISGFWLVPALLFDRPFLFRSMLKGLPAAYERVAEYARQHRDRWPLVTDSPQVGSILTYGYDVPTLTLSDRGAAEVANGTFLGELGLGFDPFALRNTPGIDARVSGTYLERTADKPPSELTELRVPLEAGIFGPPLFDLQVPAGHLSLRSHETRHMKDGSLVSNGHGGMILNGPWVDLAPGSYRVELYGRTNGRKNERVGTFDVIYDAGHQSVGEATLTAPPHSKGERLLAGVSFTLEKAISGVEFRVRVEPKVDITLTRLRLKRTRL